MKPLFLLVLLAAIAPAATHRVCWSVKTAVDVHCGEPLSKRAADEFVARVGLEFPQLHYWVATEGTRANWNRARLAATAFALAAGIYDAHTTTSVLAAGGVEKNALYGSHPSGVRLYGTNIGAVAAPLLLTEWWRRRHPDAAEALDKGGFVAALAGGSVHFGAGLHNESVLEKQKSLQGR
jgi:hypothetical protein